MTVQTAQATPLPVPRVEVRPMLRNVYMWMVLGLLLTAGSAKFTLSTGLVVRLVTNGWLMWGLFILQLILVAVLAMRVASMSRGAATAVFLGYAALTGVTLSTLVLYYGQADLTLAFVSASAIFVVMSGVGLFTKTDLTSWGPYLFAGLIAIVVALILNIFLASGTLSLVISIIGVLLFTALTAFDTQKIAALASDPKVEGEGKEMMGKLSILGALTLYLDFLNLFLFLLRIIGRN